MEGGVPQSGTSIVKEFWIYAHNFHGYMNTFMLGNGRPDIIIPGFDTKANFNSTLDLHHYVVK